MRMMTKEAQIQAIVDEVFPRLVAGEVTLEAVLAEHPAQAEALRPYLESALWLSAQQANLKPRPGYLEGGKKQLLHMVRAAGPATFWQRLWRPHSPQRTALQALSLSLLVVSLGLVLNTLVLASRLALPGEWLYPAKLSIEQVQLALTIDPQEQARLQIEHTQHRTTEIVQLVLENQVTYLPETVGRLEDQIGEAVVDLATAQQDDAAQAQAMKTSMAAMLENERFIFTVLRDMEPTTAHSSLNQAIAATDAGLSSLQN